MLNWTERIIRMRKEVPEIGWGDFKVIATRDPAVLVIRYDWRNNSVLFVHNLDEKPREVSFAVGLPGDSGKLLVNLLAEDHSRADERQAHASAGGLWLSLVSRRRPRLSPEAQRHRHRCDGQDQSSCVRTGRADDHALIAAQIERAMHPLAPPVQECRQQDFTVQPAALDAIETGSAPRFSAIDDRARPRLSRRYSKISPCAAIGS